MASKPSSSTSTASGDGVQRPASRQLTTIDLGPLRSDVATASAQAGVGMAPWIRGLIERELVRQDPAGSGGDARPTHAPETAASDRVFRAWLDADLTGKLDERVRRDGFSSRATALRALITGVGVTAPGSASLRDAVDLLGLSNHALVAVARDLNRIASAMESSRSATLDRRAVEEALVAIRKHLEAASQLVGQLRPTLKRATNHDSAGG